MFLLMLPLEEEHSFICLPSAYSILEVYAQIRVTFVNELGVEEAGIDGGGIFKDFMENITRAAFDVQYGLFKVSHSFFSSQHKINTSICTY